jgi:hypothetical protein
LFCFVLFGSTGFELRASGIPLLEYPSTQPFFVLSIFFVGF